MKVTAVKREVLSSGGQASASFGISRTNTARIMTILRDNLYSDKVLAVLREYSSNAWDAHREAGKPDVPIEVQIPTELELIFRVRDHGFGLSEEDILRLYTQYGDSTKRDSNDVVGALGIGSKSGFCYSDSFTVTSWHDGWKRTYIAVLDASNAGEIRKMHEEPCGDETGLEVSVPALPQDLATFQHRAQQLFRYFEPPPIINVELPKLERLVTPHGVIVKAETSYRREWVAVMGCVPYRLDLMQVQGQMDHPMQTLLNSVGGAIFFDIGEVSVSASRENLEYTEGTKVAIRQKLEALVEDYRRTLLKDLFDESLSDWDRRLKGRLLDSTFHGIIPTEKKDWTMDLVVLLGPDEPQIFDLLGLSGHSQSRIRVSEKTRIFLRDDEKKKRHLRGYYTLTYTDYVVSPCSGQSLEAVRADLDTKLKAARLTGVPVLLLSSQPWDSPRHRGRAPNKKHQSRVFVLKERCGRMSPLSDNWEIVQREPTTEDVFVILEAFEPRGFADGGFYDYYLRDQQLVEYLGAVMPPIYGYKTTAKRPLETKDCTGTSYLQWREPFFKSLVTDEVQDLLLKYQWHDALSRTLGWETRYHAVDYTKALSQCLGDHHPITQVFQRWLDLRAWSAEKPQRLRLPPGLQGLVPLEEQAATSLSALLATYPLLAALDGLNFKLDHIPLWADYIRMIDQKEAK